MSVVLFGQSYKEHVRLLFRQNGMKQGQSMQLKCLLSNTPVIGSHIGSSRELSSTSNTIQNMFEEKEEEDIGSFKDIDKYRYYPQHHILFLTSLYAKIINKATHFNK